MSKAMPSGATRLLHTMLRVTDLERSLRFYVEMLGMTLLRKTDYAEGRFTLAFVGFGAEDTHSVLELTHNWDRSEPYTLGEAYGHIALASPDVAGLCSDLSARGVKITRPAGPMKHGTRVIAFIEDPDGYKIELVERS